MQIVVDDVDAIHAEYLAAGVHTERGPEDGGYGLRDFFATDHEGNGFLIGQPVTDTD